MKLSAIVRTRGGQYVWVDTYFIPMAYGKTVVFPCDIQGNVTNWVDLDVSIYFSTKKAKIGHELACKMWANILVNDNYEIIGAVK